MTILTTTSTVNGLLRIKGPDAEKFLQGQLTCDINELDKNIALPGAYCSPQGRIRANFIILKTDTDDFLMIMPKQQVPFFIEAIAPYVAFFKCELTDNSNEWHTFGLQVNTKDEPLQINDFPILGQSSWELSSLESTKCIRMPGESGRWLCLSKYTLEETIPDAIPMEATNWLRQEMFSGLIWIDETNRDKFLPHDISLPAIGGVSFTKGCYTGQEIVARMQYRGEPKYLLAIITTEPFVEDIPEKLIQLIDNSEKIKVGTAIKSLHLKDNSWIISASVKRTLLNQQQFQLSSNQRPILCSITIPDTVKESNNP